MAYKMLWDSYTMAADALPPYITKTSATVVLAMQEKCINGLQKKGFQLPVPSELSNIGFITVHGLNEGNIAPNVPSECWEMGNKTNWGIW